MSTLAKDLANQNDTLLPAAGSQLALPSCPQVPQPVIPDFPQPMPPDLMTGASSSSVVGDLGRSQSFSSCLLALPYPGGSTSPFLELDSMMFPSGDPFAYPHQPVTGWRGQQFPGQTAENSSNAALGNAPTPFAMPTSGEDIEGQLLGPNLASLVQPWLLGSSEFSSQLWRMSDMFGLPPQSRADEPQDLFPENSGSTAMNLE
jgi:hypothetical protein